MSAKERDVGSAPAFDFLESTLAPLPAENVDTDQIIPAAFLKITDRSGLGAGLFAHWRYDDPDQRSHPTRDFVLNRPEHRDAEVLLAGDNFGCGSSREHAPWALLEHGFRAVISTSFADIFRTNSLKNGLLVVEVAPEISDRLFQAVANDSASRVRIDLEKERLTLPDGEDVGFEIDPFARQCLLHGIDQLGYLVERIPEIEAYESQRLAPIDTTAARQPTR